MVFSMSNKVLKPKKLSLYYYMQHYGCNELKCAEFFKSMKWPEGFSCDSCNCHDYYLIRRQGKTKTSFVLECKHCHKQHSLLSGTVFQSCNLPLSKLLLGIVLFFNDNKGHTAVSLASELDINYKSALLLENKCRILMSMSNSEYLLESQFYEADVFYIGAESKGKPGRMTDQQKVLIILSTEYENRYPEFIKLRLIGDQKGKTLKENIEKSCITGQEKLLNTDGETGFNELKDSIRVKNKKINYENSDHRLRWTNIITGNVKNNITGIYHGIEKRSMPLYMNEQEYRFNHRNMGKTILEKVKKYLIRSYPVTRRQLVLALNQSRAFF